MRAFVGAFTLMIVGPKLQINFLRHTGARATDFSLNIRWQMI